MKLTKEDMSLLRSDRNAFLVKAYLSCDDTPTTRECAELLGMSHSTCFRLMKRFGYSPKSGGKSRQNETAFETAFGTRKPSKIKASRAVGETPNETAFETPNETKKCAPITIYKKIFEERYKELTGLDFYWEVKHIKALKEMVEDKIAFGMRGKGNDPTTQALADSLKLFLGIISDPWILKNYTPTIINSKYNEIITTHNSNARKPITSDRERKQQDLQDFRSALADKRKEYGI